MALRIRSGVGAALAAHRRAEALVAASELALHGYVPPPRTPVEQQRLRELAGQLASSASRLAPGWLGTALDADPPDPAVVPAASTEFVRLGVSHAVDGAPFPVVLPFGHVTFDADCQERQVADVVRALLVRLLAASPAGSLLVRLVDPDDRVAGSFATLHDAGIVPPPAVDAAGLDAVLTEAESWVRGRQQDRSLLLVIAGWPAGTGADKIGRLGALTDTARGLHLIVTGWPTSAGLPRATQVTLGHAYAEVTYPTAGPFAVTDAGLRLDAEIVLDPPPADEMVRRVCDGLAAAVVDHARITLGELLPAGRLGAGRAADGFTVVVGGQAAGPVTLRFADLFRHWLVGGRPGSGKTTLLHSVVYGLASQYPPDQLEVHVLDAAGGGSYDQLAAAVPQVRQVALGEQIPAALAQLADAAARPRDPSPRMLCVVDGLQALDRTSLATLEQVAGAVTGPHLLLAGDGVPPPGVAERCRVRIALPGGRVLDPANDAAAGLARGQAVVNTASGLGGPRGATRAHERLVTICDPYADPVALAGLQHRLSHAGGGGS